MDKLQYEEELDNFIRENVEALKFAEEVLALAKELNDTKRIISTLEEIKIIQGRIIKYNQKLYINHFELSQI